MKKIFLKSIFALSLVLGGIFFSPVLASGLDGYVTLDPNGGLGGCIGSAELCGGVAGGGLDLTANPYGLPEGSILGIISKLLFWLLALFSVLGIIGFVLSGIWYLLSAGEESMAEKGKEGMKYSIIGVIVGLSGFIIMQAVNLMLSGTTTNF